MRISFSRFSLVCGLLVLVVGMVLSKPLLAGTGDPTMGADPRFSLAGSVSPSPAPLGSTVTFRLNVTNTSDSTASFVVNGCPVQYALDGLFAPSWPCLELARWIPLDPGKSVTFDSHNTPHMTHDPHLYPLAPGLHAAVLSVVGVGSDTVEFEVLGPSPDFAYLAGRVVSESGRAMEEGFAYLTSLSSEDSTAAGTGGPAGDPGTPPGDGRPDSASTAYVAPVTQEGWFWFDAIPPGVYFLHVETPNRVVWYPGGADPDRAEPLDLAGGTYRDDLRLALGGPEPPPGPPPPPGPFFITGLVRELAPDSQSVPLDQAAVLAIPVAFDPTDSLPMPMRPAARKPGEGEDPSLPPEAGCFVDLTGPDGRFTVEVPAGSYRLLAGRLSSHRYQYWNHASRLADARLIQVPDLTMRPFSELRFDLVRLDDLSLATVTGTVLAVDPTESKPPRPLSGAIVIADPVVPSPVAEPAPHRVTTADDGSYAMDLPADTPYRIRVEADGYGTQFYRDALHPDGAQWVDVAPGETSEGIDFILQRQGPHPGEGVIVGSVFRADSLFDCGPGQDCVVPAAGAVVRVTAAFPTFAPYEVRTRVGEDGGFRVDGLMTAPDGSLSYYVSAELSGYARAYYPDGVPFARAEPLPVLPGEVADAGRIVLGRQIPGPPSPGFLDGRITASDGRPVEDALVRAFLDPENPGGRVVTAHTGSDGWFHMRNLPGATQVLVAAEAEGFVPAYFPNAHRWREAEPVPVGSDVSYVEPVAMTLYAAAKGGPYLQAGRVRIATEESADDTLFTGPSRPRLLAMAWHRENLPGAFFYLVNALSMAPMPVVMAGESTGDNGTVVLTGLPEGTYFAYADRPGYETAEFTDETGAAVQLELNANTPAVLADIRLHPVGDVAPPEQRTANEHRFIHTLSNAPNPFRPRTVIQFDLAESCPITLQIFDYRGRLVRRLLVDDFRGAGPNYVPWNATDDNGRRVSPGVYFYRVDAERESIARKMVVLP